MTGRTDTHTETNADSDGDGQPPPVGDPRHLSLREYQQTAVDLFFAAEEDVDDARLGQLGPPSRWRVYRNMVRRRLRNLIHAAMPRTLRHLGEATFDGHVDAYFEQSPPTERYFREIPERFAAFLRERQPETGAIRELIDYELSAWTVKYVDARLPSGVVVTDFAFDKPPVCTPALRFFRARYPVHDKRADLAEPRDVNLAVYRRADHKAGTWELNDIAAALLETWIPGDRSMTECVQVVTRARGTAIDQAFLEKLSALLADFLERGILLGSRASAEPDAG